MSVGTVNTIIHKNLFFGKVSARWVPRQLSAFDCYRRLQISNDLKERFVTEYHTFLDRIFTCNETWVHHFIPESKRASKQWKHMESTPPKEFRRIASAGKVMASVLWDKSGIIHVDFLPRDINSDYYCCNGPTFGRSIESPGSDLARRTPVERKKRGFVKQIITKTIYSIEV